MDQVKIGQFVAQCRKEKNLTQTQLAEQLNLTDRAVSKWETGKGLPDASIMPDLCGLLGISINELFSGERIYTDDYKRKAEENLLRIKKEAERAKAFRILIVCFSFFSLTLIVSSLFVFIFTDGKAYSAMLTLGTLGVSTAITSLSLYIGYRLERQKKDKYIKNR